MDEQTNPQTNDHGDDQSPQTNEASLSELALTLIKVSYPRMPDAPNRAEPRLLPGQTPPGFTEEVPLPLDSRVVGSLLTDSATVVLDTAHSWEEVIAFYHDNLLPLGWLAQEDMRPPHGGFLHSGMFDRGFANFYREDGREVSVMTQPAAAGRTSVHVTLNPKGDAPMRAARSRGRRMHHDIWEVLPPIAPPPHAEQYQEGGSGGDDRVSTSARVESDADLPTLAAHYQAQLQRAGWQQRASGESEVVAWSAWTFEDEEHEPWRAFFALLKRPDIARRYWAQLQAEWVGTEPASGARMRTSLLGWQTHTQMR